MAEKIRVKHITNSLYQMEKWCRYLRLALYQMDPAMLVSTDDEVPASPVFKRPPILAMGCPPQQPEHGPDCACTDCCDETTHPGKGHGKGGSKGGGKGAGKGGGKKKAARK